jgi:hypothetical protein
MTEPIQSPWTPEESYQAGWRMAGNSIQRRLKAKKDPFLAQPSQKTFASYAGEAWTDFLQGWIARMKEEKNRGTHS